MKGRLDVLVTTPLGRYGKGGIDRLMDGMREAIERAPPPGVRIRFGVTRGQGSILLAPLWTAIFLLKTLWLRLTGRLDLVHINLSNDGSTYRKSVVALLACLLGTPYVLHLHSGGYPAFYTGASARWQRIVRSMFGHAARVVVLGSVWKDYVRTINSGIDAVILPNATAAPRNLPTRDDATVRIAFLGRLGPLKGVPELVTAAASLASLPNWSMTLAGDGAVEETRARIAALGLADLVTVPGWLGPAESETLIANAQVLVLPSHVENLPMSVIEGMAWGCSVVTTPVGATPDIVEDGVNGLFVPVGDAVALTATLKRVITHPDLRDRLGAAARETHSERLSFESFVPALVRIWRDAAR